jgi:LysM repeat protein
MLRKHWLLVLLFGLVDGALLPVLWFTVVVPWRASTEANPAIISQATQLSQNIGATQTAWKRLTPLPTPSSTPTPNFTVYTVVEGDSLWTIAAQFEISLGDLLAANPGIAPDSLFPGDELIIPGAGYTPAVTAHPVTPSTPSGSMAQVAADGDGLRLRETPGTDGTVITLLKASTPLNIVERTADNAWLQVTTPTGLQGWVSAEHVQVNVSLEKIPVSGCSLVPASLCPTTTVGPVTSKGQATTATPGPSARPLTEFPAVTASAPLRAYPDPAHPYISGITEHAKTIFLSGQSLGNRANVFSKVGDSITVSGAFLNPIGKGQYDLQEYTYLAPVITYFSEAPARDSNSFANTSLAAKVGWSVASVFYPSAANTDYCEDGETPLGCEYRLVKPSIALIMLGTNNVPGTSAERYESYLRKVVGTTIGLGIIPVLSTIPALHREGTEGRVELLNGIITRVAREYDIPLWDYWSALHGLPNDGLGSDGVHPTWAPAGHSADFTDDYLQYGMTVRNLTALQALDAVWQSVLLH